MRRKPLHQRGNRLRLVFYAPTRGLIGYQGDLYGKTLTLEFVKRLRETKPFTNVAELIEQLQRDVDAARRVIAEGSDTQ